MDNRNQLELIFKDYDTLKELYAQSESAIQNLFNFYLSFLSIIVGAFIILLQSGSQTNLLASVILITFAILVGIIYQSGIVRKIADQLVYAQAINEVRSLIATQLDNSMRLPYKLPFRLYAYERSGKTKIQKWEKRLRWPFPISTHQLFIAIFNSAGIVVFIWIMLAYADMVVSKMWQGAITSMVIFLIAYLSNNYFALLKLDQEINRQDIQIFDAAIMSVRNENAT